MDIEASITERLQKLRQWQVERQERLLEQQRIQREILSHNQDRIYKVLGLPAYDLDIENSENMCVMSDMEMDAKETMSDKGLVQCSTKNLDGVLKIFEKGVSTNVESSCKNYNEEQSEYSTDTDCISVIVNKNRDSLKDYSCGILSQKEELSDSLIEGIKPLSLDNVSNRCASIDDIPLPSPKKDFQTLLEEKLKKESEIMLNVYTNVKNKPKKPFLKKRQGLSRFKLTTNLHPLTTTTKKYSTSLFNTQHIDRNDKSKKSSVHKHISLKTLNNVSVANGKRKLSLKTVPLPKNNILSKSITPINRTMCNVISNRSKYLSEMKDNVSDLDSKMEKELEEVRMFELLEEKAENSSFCSTSSTVLAFLQQSTPFKVKNRLSQAKEERSIVTNKIQQNDERTNDTTERKPMVQQVSYIENSKPRLDRQVEQFDLHKRSHTNTATIDSYWDTVTDNVQEEIQNHFIPADQILQSNEEYVDHPESHDTSIISVLSNSDEERDIFIENDRDLTRNNEADTGHRVRFSEYNEYRTIDLTDTSDTTNNSPLKDYFEQQNWNDHFVDTSELSNVEEKLPFNYEEQTNNSSLKVISNEKTVGTPKQSSLQQDIRGSKKNSYDDITKTIHVPEEENSLCYKNGLPNEDICCDNEYTSIIEEIAQTSDKERSNLSSPLSSSSFSSNELSTYERKEYILRSEPEKVTEKVKKICLNAKEIDLHPSEDWTNQTNTFETELLKNRLLELEKEIDIFRKESSALLRQRRKLQIDETILHKKYAEKEKNFEENKKRVQNQLEEEKKKVTREKIAMENRIRDAQEKATQNKMERQKARNLQEQLEQLRDELNIKESRWNATESRYKSELRILRVEISKLKQEIVNLQNTRRTNVRNLRKSTRQVITKAINQINKRIDVVPSKETSMKMCQDLSDSSIHGNNDEDEDKNKNKSIELIMKSVSVSNGFGQIEDDIFVNEVKPNEVKIESQPKYEPKKFPEENIVKKKQDLYENLLKDATSDLVETQNLFHMKQDMLSDSQPIITQIQNLNAKSNDKSYSSPTNQNLEHTTACAANSMEYSINKSREENQDLHIDENDIRIQNRVLLPERNISSMLYSSSIQNQISKTSTKDNVKQIQYSDGCIENWYPNGNVKKIFPDQETTKMIYYNGDVRETDKNGKVKYFYATTRTLHTTTPDGLEILEFPDGQVEKRMSDGTIEVSFPDGAVRIAQADGTEKWSLPDGTIVQTFINGDKILTLPNGQREIHTKAYKRREYPDGTVKLVYADGIQETRYSSGRKRLKDKDGNLLMDLYDV